MRKTLALFTCMLAVSGCRAKQASSGVLDAGIVATPADDQRGTAFCWAYAVVGHLEQRFYEETRGPSGGGFRLNFSEEYLGLAHIAGQLLDGRPINEGLRLSAALALVDKFGIVPEKVGDKNLFKAKFDEALGPKVSDAALSYWTERQEPENTPIAPADALKILGDAAGLEAAQRKMLAAALGLGPTADAQFTYANGTYTPQTWAKNRLKFSAADYHVVRLGDPTADGYATSLKILKKALIYGYSVPISFNIVQGSVAEQGQIRCREAGCWDAELATPTPAWPHANHAVLMIDTMPDAWVIKNSWGLNGNTSSAPELLKRYPLPTYTIMSQEFYAASHRLAPGRYEALVPKKVCVKDLTPQRKLVCTPLVDGDAVDMTIDEPLIAGNKNLAALSRYAVERDEAAQALPAATLALTSKRDNDVLCIEAKVAPPVKYAAVYFGNDKTPSGVLSEQSAWKWCLPAPPMQVVAVQALNDRFKVLGQVSGELPTP